LSAVLQSNLFRESLSFQISVAEMIFFYSAITHPPDLILVLNNGLINGTPS
jgi:hypothetical protein